MKFGDLLTRGTIWMALCFYAAGVAAMLLGSGRPRWLAKARLVWTIGCAFFLAHVACAFGYYHGWSHLAAYRETARQTAEMTGFRWGGGLFLNYLFAVAWLADASWWWIDPATFARRSRRLTMTLHGFFFFMVFNGAVIFAHGPVRWLGLLICVALVVIWTRTRRWHGGPTVVK